MLPQIPPHSWRGRSPAAALLFLVWLVVGVPLGVATGLVLLVVGVAAAVVALAGWLVWAALAWVWFWLERAQRIPYPFRLRPPEGKRERRLVGNSLYLELAPRIVGGAARLAGVLFGPLLLVASAAGVFSPRWRARPYLAVFTLAAVLRKVVGLGRRRGLLRDGHDSRVLRYDEFLSSAFPHIRDFLDWWRDPDASREYTPSPTLADVPAALLGLELEPYPDPLGYPGLAAGALRRRSIRSLREVFLSQREIDDLCDPDLDDRADVGVIRVSSRVDAHGLRHWIVQFPSTKSWHPRAGAAPNDLTADLVVGAAQEPTVTRAALDTMRAAGILPGEPVLLAGFSLGGMVAAQVAERAARSGWSIAHLVVGGTPLGRARIPDGVRVLAIEHVLDLVPRIDGRENPLRRAMSTTGADGFVTVKAGPPLPVGFRLGALHQSTAYADTAQAIEAEPPDARVASLLDELAAYFGGDQTVVDHAMLRAGGLGPQPSVPFYLHSTVQEGITRGTLRQTLRRVPDVIAVDVYQSRAGFATTILWNADVLVRSLKPWFASVERFAVYRGLLSLLKRRPAVGIHFRLQAKETPGVTWEATVQRMADGRWRETLDVSFDDDAARAEFESAFPGGAEPTVVFHPPSAFDPVFDTAAR